MEDAIKKRVMAILNYDVWGYLMKKFEVTPKRKFDLFFYSLLAISFFLDYFIINAHMLFFAYTLIFAISIMLNDNEFYEIKEVKLWEVVIGLIIIISSFTIVTVIKWYFVPGTRIFGIFNGGTLIIGYFIIFYGLKKYKTTFPFLIFYLLLVIFNGVWGYIVNNLAEEYIAPASSHLAYSFLKLLGYPISISGTTITIISQKGIAISATVAGGCSGIEGMTLSAIMLVGLLMGSKLSYLLRTIVILGAVSIMFFINIFRLSLTFIAAYYWGHDGLNLAHEWLGNLMFLAFILGYWYTIDKFFIRKKAGVADEESKTI